MAKPNLLFFHGRTNDPPGRTGRAMIKDFPDIIVPNLGPKFHQISFDQQLECLTSFFEDGFPILVGYSMGAYLALHALLRGIQEDFPLPKIMILAACHFGESGPEMWEKGIFMRAPGAPWIRKAFGLGGSPELVLPEDLTVHFLHGENDEQCSVAEVRRVVSHFPNQMVLTTYQGGHRLSEAGMQSLAGMISQGLAEVDIPAEQ